MKKKNRKKKNQKTVEKIEQKIRTKKIVQEKSKQNNNLKILNFKVENRTKFEKLKKKEIHNFIISITISKLKKNRKSKLLIFSKIKN